MQQQQGGGSLSARICVNLGEQIPADWSHTDVPASSGSQPLLCPTRGNDDAQYVHTKLA
jgi:hypothetical protein